MKKVTSIGRMHGHASYADGGSSSGGSLDRYVASLASLGYVPVASAAPFEACLRLSGPVLQAGLPRPHERFNHQREAAGLLLEGGFLVEANLAGVGGYGSFDYVGWDEYRLETELPAGTVRFGQVVQKGRHVAWEDEK